MSWEVVQWLGNNFLPVVRVTGIEQMTWVVPPTLRARNRVRDAVDLFPLAAINLFHDVESAVSWLQQTCPPPPSSGCALPGRSYADESALCDLVENLTAQLRATTLVEVAPGPLGC